MLGVEQATSARQSLSEIPSIAELFARLERVLQKLWLSVFSWRTLEVIAPIYDLLCEMMALHGLAFARHGNE
jgi:hypothetical protein